ncbi:aspartate kinase [Atopostipes suicloacalis DSM 15692]|uniref:Aspartokinase n=1 Tax=Atopostipes suicloacalis DSM 15692 TaxID=1121025 RepID=A0A1M4WE86_9LACT|nr:aspartate kinase [Atopostipes suicloacalis]SHE79480.1 aspartate kinase [Atopostipes suicloacalis DSM 15692]
MKSNITVLKYGGSSISSFEKIQKIAAYLKERVDHDEQLVIVVSAMGKMTDELLKNVAQITNNPNQEDLAMLLTTGEQQSIAYLSMALKELSIKSKSLTGYQAGIQTVGHHLKSKIASISAERFLELFKLNDIIIVAGFQGFNEFGELTTLGRGGSDTTAAAIASILKIPCEIYTDVDGIYSTDPRVYSNAKKIDKISAAEMMEMSSLGAGVLEARCVEIAFNNNIPLYIGKTLSDKKGTWIMPDDKMLERKAVTGVALDEDVIQVSLSYPTTDFKLLNDLFNLLDESEINIDMISQIDDEKHLQFSFTAKHNDRIQIEALTSVLKESYQELEVIINQEFVKLSVIGAGMRDMHGVASKVFRTLIENEIPFSQVTTSQISITFLIDAENDQKATHILCESFNL